MTSISTLDQLVAGDSAIVVDVHESSEVREHLASRGIGPGVPVHILKQGDPLIVAVENARWAIGRTHAKAVSVVAEELDPRP